MKAVILKQYGGAEQLELRDIARPEPGPGQLRVRVVAATLNPGNVKRGAGALRGLVPELEFPWVPGADFSGVVDALGAGVEGFAPGDEVFGYGGAGGAFAEFLVSEVDALAHKPRTLDHAGAASLAVVAQTAVQAFELGELQAGQSLLILGAGGAVGNAALQLARHRGVRVIAVCRARSAARLVELGAEQVFDDAATPLETVVQGVDMVLDGLGGETARRALSVLEPGGVLVALNGPPAEDEAERLGVRALFLRTQNRGNGLARLAAEIDAVPVRPFLARSYALAETAQAWRDFEAGGIEGKLVIRVGEA
ncbi:NADP-dependent oxidoreductase [Burkholderia sp. Ap-962]|uniref:NADP-dependent oxidoreductase n=1 Tax=Burkholderia sp. Ap-962 TaxID=2608333 RepID=UPI00141E7F7E|nr:NADP-dependent oxidoreductase [Burkholderia sp. Ap-962]NIF72759.1 NADP-dependent oxidoreductase [Burkholderia sp. Ap-962]